ncbi:NMDA receptor synaptonuclear signaling and neuronal migration factor-like [Physella acuta]|uniref:NMDA receptor synaptonuclear signaling and neuronal migration factor-like n=1 Tax=Physella acuta TaxID=109671 RepID=UPI0027DAEA01|nr:NMDA receptor synaptonuclear signaling and neuronal migration factor-like [Physella acuta]
MLNKREPVIHIVGADLCSNKQGEELKRMISLSMPHSHVKIESIDDIDPEGQAKISLYFNYRKYLLWRSRTENVDDTTGVYDDTADDKNIKTCVEIENLRSITKL